MLTELEILLQQQTLKIHPDFQQLLAELADYRLPHHAHAVASGGRINRRLFYELNDLGGPPPGWYDRQKITTDGPGFGLVKLNPPPGSDRLSYQADALTGELEEMLAQGWTVADPAALDKLGLGHLVGER